MSLCIIDIMGLNNRSIEVNDKLNTVFYTLAVNIVFILDDILNSVVIILSNRTRFTLLESDPQLLSPLLRLTPTGQWKA